MRLLPILPAQYWRLTIAEFAEMMAGVTRREEAEWERTAWLASTIINIAGKSVKNPVTVDQLMNRQKAYSNPEADFKELMLRQESIDAEHSN